MRRILLLLALGTLAACHDSDGSPATAFDPFVTGLIQDQTTESAEPVGVEGKAFAFPAGADAFDDLLPPDDGAVVE